MLIHLFLCLFVTAAAWAQTSTGLITGVVLDPSGAVVPNATVRLIGTETGEVARELTSADDGSFTAPLLRPSNYTIEVTAQGFKRLVRSGVALRVDDQLSLRLTLETGATSYLRGLDNRARDAMRPSLEAIAEFKVQTSNYSAEYGASAGAVVNVVTKSGTNEIHGSAFEFLRNDKMDARDYFLPTSSQQPLYIQHQFGGSLGGPIIRNRAWVHGAFQRTHISEGEVGTATVPLASERNGTFAAPVYDPYTTRPNPSGSGSVRDVFPSNAIPATRFDPVGKSLVDRYPDPIGPAPPPIG